MKTYTSGYRTLILLTLLAMGFTLANANSAHAQEPPAPEARILQPGSLALFVVGRDTVVPVKAQLPAACYGQDVEVALYDRSGPRVLGLVAGTVPVKTRVSAAGTVEAQVPMPKTPPPAFGSGWPGVSGPCLKEPLVAIHLGIVFGFVDEAANGKDAATFVVPAYVLVSNTGKAIEGTLTPVMNGAPCATVDLANAQAKDSAGNLRIRVGGPGQPPECSRAGNEVRFTFADGRVLFERRTFVPGVTQPYRNLAPEAAPNTGPVPGAPTAGQGPVAGSDAGRYGWTLRFGLALLLLSAGAAVFVRTGRPAR